MIYLWLFIFGICAGSFISCLVYRLNHNLTLSGRSVCDHCGKQLAWYDNIPLFSYLILRGKCRKCQSPIPFQYFLTELITGILFVLMFRNMVTIEIVLAGFILLSLVALFISDLNYQTIPDIIIFPSIVVAVIYRLTIQQFNNLTIDLITLVAATVLFLVLSRIKLRGQQAMGFGDVELVFLMGLFLGFPKIVLALYLAFLTGAVIGVILIILGKKKLQSAIPFGPFLITGTFIAYFLGDLIWKKIMGLL